MTLIKSISGIRGTIGGFPDEALTPLDMVKFTASFGQWLKINSQSDRLTLVLGRDARISGEMVRTLVSGTLCGMGIDVIDLGLSTTPTVEIMVEHLNADGGIIITASHNPAQWNALKLLNHKGEFISAKDGAEVLEIAQNNQYQFCTYDQLGKYQMVNNAIDIHIEKVMQLPLINVEKIKQQNFTVVLDAVNSTGGISIIPLLKKLGVHNIVELNCEPTGIFAHNPEPLPEHLTQISSEIVKNKAHLGIVVDPDVDRLALVMENGNMFGEEYTIVAIADFILSKENGNTVSNLSSSRALYDVTLKHGGKYAAAAVGEVNVVNKMKETNAIFGGEGNGGVIYPELHYGRDALVGVALFLTHLAEQNISMTALKAKYPQYHISKNKIELTPEINVDSILDKMAAKYQDQRVNTIDGVKIDFDASKEWVHLRKSNTEPIIRIYAESANAEKADGLANRIINDIKEMI